MMPKCTAIRAWANGKPGAAGWVLRSFGTTSPPAFDYSRFQTSTAELTAFSRNRPVEELTKTAENYYALFHLTRYGTRISSHDDYGSRYS